MKAGDWVVFDLKVGQIKEIKENRIAEFTDGFISISGMELGLRFRPLTLRNKVIAETFHTLYRRLDDINGCAGFNYPDISSYFAELALQAMDGDEGAERAAYDKAQEFLREASDYRPMIHGVHLFRPNFRRVR